jgi:hypothetical protein
MIHSKLMLFAEEFASHHVSVQKVGEFDKKTVVA